MYLVGILESMREDGKERNPQHLILVVSDDNSQNSPLTLLLNIAALLRATHPPSAPFACA